MSIDDQKVEQIFVQFRRALNAGQSMDLAHMQALAERFRVELMIADVSPARRAIYRSIIDMFEDIIEQEADKQDAARPKGSNALVAYVKRLVQGLG
tara:strand:+ start:254 stop:541 length:288 start_codon:yes stop_codon:yes gene_type:complete